MKPCGHAAPGTAWTTQHRVAHPAPLACTTLRVAHMPTRPTRDCRAKINMSWLAKVEMSGSAVHWLPKIGGQAAATGDIG